MELGTTSQKEQRSHLTYRPPTPGSQDVQNLQDIPIWSSEPLPILLHAVLGLEGWPL